MYIGTETIIHVIVCTISESSLKFGSQRKFKGMPCVIEGRHNGMANAVQFQFGIQNKFQDYF